MTKYFNKFVILVVSGVFLLLTGCDTTVDENVRDNSDSIEHFYSLPDNGPGYKFKSPMLRGVLGISPIDADGIRSDRRMLFKKSNSPLELRLHHFRFWTDSPTKLVQQKIADYFRRMGLANKVIRYKPGNKVDYLLHGRLLKFERYVDTKSNQDKVLVSIELNISKESTGQLVVSNTVIHIREKAPRAANANKTIVNAVKSFNSALTKALIMFIKKHSPKRYAQRIMVKPEKESPEPKDKNKKSR